MTSHDRQPCPACGEARSEPFFHGSDRLYGTTDKVFSVVSCLHCGLLHLHPQPSVEELSQYYPESYWHAPQTSLVGRMEEAYRRFVLRDHLQFVRHAIEDSAAPGIVLDVGCGGGLFLSLLRGLRPRMIGLDISEEAARVAWQHRQVPTLCGSLLTAPLREQSCAAITLFHVLEHLHHPEEFLQAARRLLHPHGRLIVQVPNADCWQLLVLGERWNGLDVPRHLINFRVSDLEKLLEYCGFSVVRRKHFSLRDNPAGLATSLAPSLDPMARQIRGVPENLWQRLAKSVAYLALVAASLPFAVAEAAARAGSTIMLEARRTS